MKILDRYIVRQFLVNFIILSVVMLSLFVLVDLIVDLDEFITAGKDRLEAHPEFAYLWIAILYSIFDFYYPIALLMYVFFSGLVVVAAMGFTFTALSRNGELVAMVTSGISMYRIAAPILVTGFVLNILALPIQEYLVPPLANKLARGKSQARFDYVETFEVRFAVDRNGSLLSAAEFDAAQKLLRKVVILIRDDQGQAIERLTASSARWNEVRQGWELTDGQMVKRESGADRASMLTRRVVRDESFYPTTLSPQVLLARRAAIYPRLLSMTELLQMSYVTNNQNDADTLHRIMHSRFSLMGMNLLILVLALPFYLNREPVNFMVQAVKAAGVCLGAWCNGLVLMQGGAGLNPATAAWLPVVILLPIAAIFLFRIKT